MSILCQNAFTKSVFFKHGFDPFEHVKNPLHPLPWFPLQKMFAVMEFYPLMPGDVGLIA